MPQLIVDLIPPWLITPANASAIIEAFSAPRRELRRLLNRLDDLDAIVRLRTNDWLDPSMDDALACVMEASSARELHVCATMPVLDNSPKKQRETAAVIGSIMPLFAAAESVMSKQYGGEKGEHELERAADAVRGFELARDAMRGVLHGRFLCGTELAQDTTDRHKETYDPHADWARICAACDSASVPIDAVIQAFSDERLASVEPIIEASRFVNGTLCKKFGVCVINRAVTPDEFTTRLIAQAKLVAPRVDYLGCYVWAREVQVLTMQRHWLNTLAVIEAVEAA